MSARFKLPWAWADKRRRLPDIERTITVAIWLREAAHAHVQGLAPAAIGLRGCHVVDLRRVVPRAGNWIVIRSDDG